MHAELQLVNENGLQQESCTPSRQSQTCHANWLQKAPAQVGESGSWTFDGYPGECMQCILLGSSPACACQHRPCHVDLEPGSMDALPSMHIAQMLSTSGVHISLHWLLIAHLAVHHHHSHTRLNDQHQMMQVQV